MDEDKYRDPHLYPKHRVKDRRTHSPTWGVFIKSFLYDLSNPAEEVVEVSESEKMKGTKETRPKNSRICTYVNEQRLKQHAWSVSMTKTSPMATDHPAHPQGETSGIGSASALSSGEPGKIYCLKKNLFSIKIMIMKTANIRVWLQLFRPLCCLFNFYSED